MTQTVVGFFDSASEAQQAVKALMNSGFTDENVDLSNSSSNREESKNFNLGNDEHETGVKGFFKNLFGNDDDNADRYSTVANRSDAMVTVYATSADEAERAADILDNNGAVNVEDKASEYGYTGNAAMNNGDTAMDTMGDANQSIKIIEENLSVGKKTVETGGVRLKSRIVEHPIEEQIRLREERINVNRTSVNRPATEADFAAFKEGTVEMTENAEVPVVSKEARVVEEVSLGKEASERNETIRDTVRKTEVDVEELNDNNMSSTREMRGNNSSNN